MITKSGWTTRRPAPRFSNTFSARTVSLLLGGVGTVEVAIDFVPDLLLARCPPVRDASDPLIEERGDRVNGLVGDRLVDREEREEALGIGIVAITGSTEANAACSRDVGAVGPDQDVRDLSEEQERSVAAVTRPPGPDIDLDLNHYGAATAIPGMCLSSPINAEETVTAKPSMASGVSRSR